MNPQNKELKKSNTSNKELFQIWLKKNGVHNPNPTIIIEAFDEVSAFAVSRKLCQVEIWNIKDVNVFRMLKKTVLQNKFFRSIHRYAAMIFEKTSEMYVRFLNEKEKILLSVQPQKEPVAIVTTEKNEAENNDFYNWLLNIEKMAINSCKGYVSSLKSISIYAVGMKILDKRLDEINDPEELREKATILIGDKRFLEYNEQQHNRFSAAIRKYVIYKTGVDIYKVLKDDKTKYTDGIIKLVSSRFKYGFRLDSPIEILRLKQFAENDGIELPDSDEEIKKEIKRVALVFDGKAYIFSNETISGLVLMLNEIKEQGHKVVFYEVLQDVKSEWFQENNLIQEDVLKEVLSIHCRDFYVGRNFIYFGEKITEIEAVINEIKRVWNEGINCTFEEISSKLPWTPLEKIKHALANTEEFVWNSFETYSNLEKIVISEYEKDEIIEYVQTTCDRVGYAALSDVPLGNIQIVNYELSDTALYNAIYILVLKDKFFLNGKILTKSKSNIDTVYLVKTYCLEREECTFDELNEKVRELNGGYNRQQAFEAAYDTMVRVEKNRFVADEFVDFQVDEIDNVLESIIGDDFVAIKSIATFALFPFCEQTWNHYLLESFCYRFSKKFRLFVLNFNDKNAGIISNQKNSYTYKEMLEIVLAKSNIELNEENAGKYLFDMGYLAKSKYAALGSIVERAIELREEI